MPITNMAITVITEEQMEHLRYARQTRWPSCHDQDMRKNLLIANTESDGHVYNEDRRCSTDVRCYYMDLHGDADEDRHCLLTRVLDANS